MLADTLATWVPVVARGSVAVNLRTLTQSIIVDVPKTSVTEKDINLIGDPKVEFLAVASRAAPVV